MLQQILLGVRRKNVLSSSHAEIKQFLKLPPIDLSQWCHATRPSLPQMSKMAYDYLSTPTSLVPTEEANLATKLTFDEKAKPYCYTFTAKIFVRSWIRVLKNIDLPMPKDFHEAYEAMKSKLENMVNDDEVIDYALEPYYVVHNQNTFEKEFVPISVDLAYNFLRSSPTKLYADQVDL